MDMTIKEGAVIKKRGSFINDKKASGHPIIVVDFDENIVWGAICTSAENASKFSHVIDIDWQACNLSKATVVICDKLRKFNVSDVSKYYGDLLQLDYHNVLTELNRYNAIDDLKETLYWR